jgi:hypothetical protein
MSGKRNKDGLDVQKATAIAGNCKEWQVFRVLEAVETVNVDNIEPRDLWDRFISQRKPVRYCELVILSQAGTNITTVFLHVFLWQVIIAGHPRDAEWKVHQRWSNEYLECRAVSVIR